MTILGIDPGTATTGYAIIKTTKTPGAFEAVDFGVITTKKGESDAHRLLVLSQDLGKVIKKHKPERAGVEKLFFTKNQTTAMTVSQARGVALLACEQNAIPIFEFTPLQVKNIICGYGTAEKRQVQFMVKQTFRLSAIPKPDDAADALAIALCAALTNPKFH
jgi:crossover junction endodeoxyribonuclease RuvC